MKPCPSPQLAPEPGQGFHLLGGAMRKFHFDEEAERCRRQALSYLGPREAPFLLRVAHELDSLAKDNGECAFYTKRSRHMDEDQPQPAS